MLVRMLPADSSELGGLLDGIADPGELWTQYGLRSLSRNSSIYNQYNTEHDAPYWRAPIWLNINFLALSALKHYSQVCLAPSLMLLRQSYVCMHGISMLPVSCRPQDGIRRRPCSSIRP